MTTTSRRRRDRGAGGPHRDDLAEIDPVVVRIVVQLLGPAQQSLPSPDLRDVIAAPVLFVGAAFYALLFGRDP